MEKRKFSRILFKAEAIISCNNCTYKGKVKDLSLNGAYLELDQKNNIKLDDKVNITLLLTGTTSELNLNIEGIIQRVDKTGLGLKFISIDLDSFVYLRNIIAYNSGNYEKIMDEFYDSIVEDDNKYF